MAASMGLPCLSAVRRILISGVCSCPKTSEASRRALISSPLSFSANSLKTQARSLHYLSQHEGVDSLYKQVTIEIRGHDPAVLNSYSYFASTAAKHLGIPDIQVVSPPKVIERRTLLKSIHKYGKYHKVQYERRTHFKVIELKNLTGSTADTYLEYMQRNLPEGAAMKVVKVKAYKLME